MGLITGHSWKILNSTSTALIGHTGFVGSNLASQSPYSEYYNSKNIQEMRGRSFDLVVCAGIQAKKWWANQNPEADWEGIEALFKILETVQASKFVLISTVDVYPDPSEVDEDSAIDAEINHVYGRHRYKAEQFVKGTFPDSLILRLPGLFGDGIKKNVIHDLLKNHELEKINPLGEYQYYFLDRLSADIQKAWDLGIKLLNLSAAPVSTVEIKNRFFPDAKIGPESEFRATYDMLSKYWKEWDSVSPGYLYGKNDVLAQLEHFIKRSASQG